MTEAPVLLAGDLLYSCAHFEALGLEANVEAHMIVNMLGANGIEAYAEEDKFWREPVGLGSIEPVPPAQRVDREIYDSEGRGTDSGL